MVIDNNLLDLLTDEARKSPRLRHSFDLRNSPEDNSQRMLNALEPGTVLNIHRHPRSSTTLIVLRGCIKQNLYDDAGFIIHSKILNNHIGQLSIYNIPQNAWHNLECLETGTIIFESKDGKYMPEIDTEFFNKK